MDIPWVGWGKASGRSEIGSHCYRLNARLERPETIVVRNVAEVRRRIARVLWEAKIWFVVEEGRNLFLVVPASREKSRYRE